MASCETGVECVLPFKYDGVTHNSCFFERGNKYWCSNKGIKDVYIKNLLLLDFKKNLKNILVDANGVHIMGNWGYCNAFCPWDEKGN